LASSQVERSTNNIIAAVERDLETARIRGVYRRTTLRIGGSGQAPVARELEARWNAALERVAELEQWGDGPGARRGLVVVRNAGKQTPQLEAVRT
jgi:hypothetical protein